MSAKESIVAKLLRWSALAATAAVVTGCALSRSTSDAIVTDCILPTDQSGTLSGRWKLQPVPIAFHQGDFAPSEMAAIVAAADTWNSFYQTSLSFTIMEYGGDGANPRQSSLAKPTSNCSQSIITGTNFTAPVVIYKDTTWPYTSQQNVIGLTTFCPVPATPLPSFNMAFIEVNYQNFFQPGGKDPDLQSILLHELGHLAGLNHSCEGYTKAGTPVCDPSNADYYNAVMAPVFGFDPSGAGQQKRSLLSNDMGRANCLYWDLFPH